MYILGISCFYHEAAAVLIKDGVIIAASAEERFSRKKHDSEFPQLAIDFCLKQAKISIKDVDYVTYYDVVIRFEYSINRKLERGLFIHFNAGI